ncbi:MAG: alpha/beta hydrolase [Eubacteriales bacterium]|nr:alpha/beta hydrolase [Eubacteriales bacterium]
MSHILIHGLGQTASAWEQTINELQIDTEIHCPNVFHLCVGSMKYSNLYKGFSEYCDTVDDKLHLCGLSLGGMLALQYAISHSDRVGSLVLIGARYQIPKRLMAIQNIIFKLMPEKMFGNMGLSKSDIIALTKSMLDIDFKKDLGVIDCPVLIICGEKDRANLKAAKQLHMILRRSKLRMIPHVGHEVNIDNPTELGKVLNDFYTEKKII